MGSTQKGKGKHRAGFQGQSLREIEIGAGEGEGRVGSFSRETVGQCPLQTTQRQQPT